MTIATHQEAASMEVVSLVQSSPCPLRSLMHWKRHCVVWILIREIMGGAQLQRGDSHRSILADRSHHSPFLNISSSVGRHRIEQNWSIELPNSKICLMKQLKHRALSPPRPTRPSIISSYIAMRWNERCNSPTRGGRITVTGRNRTSQTFSISSHPVGWEIYSEVVAVLVLRVIILLLLLSLN